MEEIENLLSAWKRAYDELGVVQKQLLAAVERESLEDIERLTAEAASLLKISDRKLEAVQASLRRLKS